MTDVILDDRTQGKTPLVPAPAAPATPEVNEDGTPKVVEVPKKDDRIAKVVSKVNKRAQALSEKEKSVAEREAAVQAFKDAPELAKTKPLELLKKLGIDPQEFINNIVKDGEAPTVDEQIASLKAEIEAERKANKDREQKLSEREAEITIHNFKQQINKYVDENKDTGCKLTKLLGRESDVYDVIEAHHTKTGELLPLDKAAQMVENHYVTAKKKEYDILKTFFENQETTPPVVDDDGEVLPPKTPIKTLTNKQNTIPSGENNRVLSRKEDFARLAAKYPKEKLV